MLQAAFLGLEAVRRKRKRKRRAGSEFDPDGQGNSSSLARIPTDLATNSGHPFLVLRQAFLPEQTATGEPSCWVIWEGVGDGEALPGVSCRDTGRLLQGLHLYCQPCAPLSQLLSPEALLKHFMREHLNLCSGVGF